MINQFCILGESMDPTIYYQTDAEYYRRITQISFIELYKKNLLPFCTRILGHLFIGLELIPSITLEDVCVAQK